MRLTKTFYYADYAIYSALITAVTCVAVWRNTGHEFSIWLLAVAGGVAIWTLTEYVVHRYVFHQMPFFSPMHDAHHQSPLAFIGTPTWLSLAVIFGALTAPAWALGSLNIAAGVTVGFMAGFTWYGVVHHAIHHRKPRILARRLIVASRRHSQHHYSAEPGNFGVTNLFWDRVFGTVISESVQREVRTRYQS